MHFLIPSSKKENPPKKISYTLGKWNFLALILRNFLYFLKRNGNPEKNFFYFKKGNPKKLFIFQEIELFELEKWKKKKHSEKNSYISGNGTL